MLYGMDQHEWDRIRTNLFPAALGAIPSWSCFPWHRGGNRQCDTHVPHSSQALAIDVFGTLGCLPAESRDVIAGDMADQLGLPDDGPWSVQLEWSDPANPLQEINQPTQVDAVLQSPKATVLVECKFTESNGGSCSQPVPRPSGANKGKRQCNGNYEPQVNPINGVEAHCALTGKGIRHWEHIPAIFGTRTDEILQPCPFTGPTYQWMRNLTTARAHAQTRSVKSGFLLVYVDGPNLHIAEMVRSGRWDAFTAGVNRGEVAVGHRDYQTLIARWIERTPQPWCADVLRGLQAWVAYKVSVVSDGRRFTQRGTASDATARQSLRH